MSKPKKKDLSLLRRLATTVKAGSTQTMVLGPLSGKPASSPKPKQKSKLSRLTKSLNPFHRVPGDAWSEDKAAKNLKKLANQMAKGKPVMKIRKSRLPLVVALVVALLCGGGYMLYRSISLPKVHVDRVAKGWLDTTSGARPKHRVAHKAKTKHSKSRHRLAKHKRHHKSRYAHKKHKRSRAKVAKSKRHGHSRSASYRRHAE